jgi:PAS domain S-box-containing protein
MGAALRGRRCGFVGLLGIWCYVAFSRTEDAFAHLISFTMTIAYVVGIFGRNVVNSRSVIIRILCAWAPITTALLVHGDVYHWIFAGLLVPFFLAVKFIAERLRQTLLDAVVATRDMTLLAKRFDTALNNMPHGLCMFDAERRIVLANKPLNEHLGLAADIELKGFTPEELVTVGADNGLIPPDQAERRVYDLDARLAGAESHPFGMELHNDRTLEFTVQPMENGGMVLLGEDITERKIARAQINHFAPFDSLTGLPNRTILRSRMDTALAPARPSRCARCTSSISINSSRSTTRLAIRVATCCSSLSPSACARSCAKPT